MSERISVLKTYKIYIGGSFPRTESGRFYTPTNSKGKSLGNICLSSRKDFRNAVVAARKAFGDWSERMAYNRSQILYRMAEVLEGRKEQFIAELILQDSSAKQAEKEVTVAIDRLVYFAGWCDKYQQIFSSVNPVASSHFNFSAIEPSGVVAIVPNQSFSLLGLVSYMAPIIAGGNTCVILASEDKPLCSISFAEVLNSSDLPGGVVNILTGKRSELLNQMASHMDVNAMCYANHNREELIQLKEGAVENLKRIKSYNYELLSSEIENPYLINDFQEVKTTWHPIEVIGAAKASY
ncbi:aldehyde dehydrogenase family protein [bacterium]|nr:aldehyde dehydrogenase family protein [bacterium]